MPLHWLQNQPPGTIVFDPTVQKSISGDTYIENYSTSSNYGSSSSLYFGINGMGITFRTLLKFNLSGIPAEALVSSATLKLYVYSLENAGSYQYSVHRVTTDWVENEATWQRPKNGAPNWNGGSYESTSLYTRTVSSTGWNYWYNLGDLVQQWLRGTVANDGLLLKGVNEGQSYNLRKGRSSEYSDSLYHPYLYVSYYEPKTVYYLKDHLGSTRVVVDEDGDVVESYDYYPFGLASRTSGGGTVYKFTEKELDNEADFYYFGARYYDQEVGRWISVDPKAEKYPSSSPYVYSTNNPIVLKDVNGEYWITAYHGQTAVFRYPMGIAYALVGSNYVPVFGGLMNTFRRVGLGDYNVSTADIALGFVGFKGIRAMLWEGIPIALNIREYARDIKERIEGNDLISQTKRDYKIFALAVALGYGEDLSTGGLGYLKLKESFLKDYTEDEVKEIFSTMDAFFRLSKEEFIKKYGEETYNKYSEAYQRSIDEDFQRE